MGWSAERTYFGRKEPSVYDSKRESLHPRFELQQLGQRKCQEFVQLLTRQCVVVHRCALASIRAFGQYSTRINVDVLDNKYQVEQLLGQGGMGAVYRAMHLGTKRTVALKLEANR